MATQRPQREQPYCVFCGVHGATVACSICMPKYLTCPQCGYLNEEYISMPEAFTAGRWLGMPAACRECGTATINFDTSVVGLKQTNFVKLSESASFIRRRLCQENN